MQHRLLIFTTIHIKQLVTRLSVQISWV